MQDKLEKTLEVLFKPKCINLGLKDLQGLLSGFICWLKTFGLSQHISILRRSSSRAVKHNL
jgi:hypothetical protein